MRKCRQQNETVNSFDYVRNATDVTFQQALDQQRVWQKEGLFLGEVQAVRILDGGFRSIDWTGFRELFALRRISIKHRNILRK